MHCLLRGRTRSQVVPQYIVLHKQPTLRRALLVLNVNVNVEACILRSTAWQDGRYDHADSNFDPDPGPVPNITLTLTPTVNLTITVTLILNLMSP